MRVMRLAGTRTDAALPCAQALLLSALHLIDLNVFERRQNQK